MAKKKAAKKATSGTGKPRTGEAADVLPGMPGKFVVLGMSSAQNRKIAEALRKKLGEG